MSAVDQPGRSSRWLWRSAWVMSGLALFAAWLAVSRAGSEPGWWEVSRTGDARVTRNAEEVEGAVMTQLTLVRESDAPWSVSLTQQDANDWLAGRLPIWLKSRGEELPPQVRAVSTAFTAEGVYLGAKVQPGGRVLWVLVEPRLDEKGLWLKASSAGIGKAPVPLEQVLASDILPVKVRAVLRGDEPALTDASTAVDGSRRVKLLDVQSHLGRLELSASTLGR